MLSKASDNARATRSRNRTRRNVTTGETDNDQASTSLERYMSNNVQATLSNTKTNVTSQPNISASSESRTNLYRPTRSGKLPGVSTASVSAEAGPSVTQVGKRRATDTSQDPTSKKRRASRLGKTALNRRQSPPPSPESSDGDDSQLIEEMLVRKARTHFRSKPTPAPHDNNGLDKQASPSTELPVSKSLVVNMSEQTRLHLPRVNDQYDSEEAFIRHVKGFAEQSGHKAYQLGGQGKHNCRMLCRNWKKIDYKPPGLGCPFHFLAARTANSQSLTIISAEPNHNAACKKREGSIDTKVYETAHNSNSKKAAKSAAKPSLPPATATRRSRRLP